MHLSTSNFERIIPNANGRVVLPSVLFIFAIFMVTWEIYWRSQGYLPTLNDEKFLWAKTRESVKANDFVIIGSSRGLFDIDIKTLEEALQIKDIKQLAMTGSSPIPILENLANDESFRGTIICDVVPGLFFTPDGVPPTIKPTEWVESYKKFSPSDKAALFLNNFLESNLAYLKQDDLPLKELLKQIKIPNRPGIIFKPKLPPYFMTMDNRREAKMIGKVLEDKPFRELIQSRWLVLFTPPPFPDNPSPEVIGQRIEGMIAGKILSVKSYLNKIKSRGGKIIFIRFPSTGPLLELESKFTPRVAFWDRLIKETEAPGIYWQDYENLKEFDCPEWSHLSATDSIRFTKEIGPIIQRMLSPTP